MSPIDAPMPMSASTPLAAPISMPMLRAVPAEMLSSTAARMLKGIPVETPIDIDASTPLDAHTDAPTLFDAHTDAPTPLDAHTDEPIPLGAPPEQFFDTREQMLASILQYALARGYATVIDRSTGDRQVYIRCDRGRIFHDSTQAPEGAKRRKTSTRRIECPFSLYASKRQKTGQWWLRIKNPKHNHDADHHMIAHPAARQLSDDQRKIIRDLSDVGTSPRQIIGVLKKQYPNILVLPTDIYNARAADRRAMLQGDTPVGHLVKKLNQDQWRYAFKQDDMGYIQFFYVWLSGIDPACSNV